MTSIELRIKFKSETGYDPTTGKTGYPQSGMCNYKGNLTSEYAAWLESEHIDLTHTSMIRHKYLKEMGKPGTYLDYNRITHYTEEYKEWLEEKICDALTLLIN